MVEQGTAWEVTEETADTGFPSKEFIDAVKQALAPAPDLLLTEPSGESGVDSSPGQEEARTSGAVARATLRFYLEEIERENAIIAATQERIDRRWPMMQQKMDEVRAAIQKLQAA